MHTQASEQLAKENPVGMDQGHWGEWEVNGGVTDNTSQSSYPQHVKAQGQLQREKISLTWHWAVDTNPQIILGQLGYGIKVSRWGSWTQSSTDATLERAA